MVGNTDKFGGCRSAFGTYVIPRGNDRLMVRENSNGTFGVKKYYGHCCGVFDAMIMEEKSGMFFDSEEFITEEEAINYLQQNVESFI